MKNTIYAGITSLTLGFGLLSCTGTPNKSCFDKIIGEERVVYYNANGEGKYSDTLIIYDLEDNLKFKIQDHNENLTIGDSRYDRYIVYDKTGNYTMYAKNFVLKNGVRFDSKDDPVEAKAIEISQKRLKEATGIYAEYLEKINLKLEEQL
ncbi:MAG: hypothetical protein ABIF40_05785 [archaeon]